jgi:ubiquinone biosynthesis protein COQ4
LSGLEKGAVALLSLWGSFADPRRADLVAASGETTGLPAIHAMRERMRRSETGRLILQQQPLITVRHCRFVVSQANTALYECINKRC